MAFFLGCAVWAHKEWLGDLFPTGTPSGAFLHTYSRRLTTVEGNTTFYAVPNPDVVQRWAEETPSSFRFCFKLPREVSHSGALVRQLPATAAFLERMTPLGERLGPFFLQLPPGYAPTQLDDLRRWLDEWPKHYQLAVEVRHDDWYAPAGEAALLDVLEQHGVGKVVMDVRPLDLGDLPGAEADMQKARDNKPAVPMHPVRSGQLAMVRYIGHPDVERNRPLLEEWAGRVAQWLDEGTTVYFFMHCPTERFSPTICRMFQRQLEQHAAVPPLPWNEIDEGLKQASFF